MNHSIYDSLRLLALLGVMLFSAGCKGPLEMTVAGGPELNAGGNAAVVKIYQLRGSTNFSTTPLQSFWQDDRAALSDDYVDHLQLLLYPNESETVPLELREETQYVGVAADLRAPAPDGWRRIYPVGDLRGKKVNVTVGADQLSVTFD